MSEREDVVTDLLEINLHLHNALPHVRPVFIALGFLLLLYSGNDASDCKSTLGSVLVGDNQQIMILDRKLCRLLVDTLHVLHLSVMSRLLQELRVRNGLPGVPVLTSPHASPTLLGEDETNELPQNVFSQQQVSSIVDACSRVQRNRPSNQRTCMSTISQRMFTHPSYTRRCHRKIVQDPVD